MSNYSNKKNKKKLKNDALKLLRDLDFKGNLRLNLSTRAFVANSPDCCIVLTSITFNWFPPSLRMIISVENNRCNLENIFLSAIFL